MKRLNAITDVPGIRVGHFTDFKALTGCKVLLCKEGATGAADIRGIASGTRQIGERNRYLTKSKSPRKKRRK